MVGLSSPLQIAVVGNCQARPIVESIKLLVPEVQVTGIAIVHLLSNSDEAQFEDAFKKADLIFAQRVNDDYPCGFVRTGELKRQYVGKVVCWPNLYFSGYNPELLYLRGADRRPLRGPLSDYHNQTVLTAWQEGLPIDQACARCLDVAYNEIYGATPELSLKEFQAREAETDIRISEWMAEHLWKQRLFFTFNHPKKVLIDQLARLMLERAEIAYREHPAAENGATKEPLGQFSVPTNPWVMQRYSQYVERSDLVDGAEIEIKAGDHIVVGKKRQYQLREMIEAFYRVYDSVKEFPSLNRIPMAR